MSDRLMIIMVNSDPQNTTALGAPFFQATVAAAMDYDVEIIMTERAGELAKSGVAESILVHEGSQKSVYDYIEGCAPGWCKVQGLHPNN